MPNQHGAFGKPDQASYPETVKPPPQVFVNPPSTVQDRPRLEVYPVGDIGGRDLVCYKRKTYSFLYGAFLELVRKLYRDGEFLVGTPDVRWGRTPQADGIWIDSEYNWKPSHPEFLPAIFVRLGPLQYKFRTGDQSRMVGANLRNGIQYGERMCDGTVTFVHVSRTGGEAIALCDNTRYRMNEFSGPIMEDLCLTRFYEQQGQPLALGQKESSEQYQSTSTFGFEFMESWGVKLESPILRSVEILPDSPRYGIVKTGTDDNCDAKNTSSGSTPAP